MEEAFLSGKRLDAKAITVLFLWNKNPQSNKIAGGIEK
jgi:hypothetical protein